MTINIIYDPLKGDEHDFEVFRGDQFQESFTLKHDNGSVVDLTGYNIYFIVCAYNGGTVYAQYTNDSGIVLTEASGAWTVTIDGTDTQGFAFENAFYVMRYGTSLDDLKTLLIGAFKVIPCTAVTI